MSFEGYYQILCDNGHHDTVDAYYMPEDNTAWSCRHCGAPEAWRNLVDVTNGSFEDCEEEECWCYEARTDGYVELEALQPEETAVCNLGHKHVTSPAQYKIPGKHGSA